MPDLGQMIGLESHIGQTKTDRAQLGEVKALPCPSDCSLKCGEIAMDEDGRIDASQLCPPHLLMYLKQLWLHSRTAMRH